jgi:hypothetical protein
MCIYVCVFVWFLKKIVIEKNRNMKEMDKICDLLVIFLVSWKL